MKTSRIFSFKNGFTMLELVFVIVVLGILAAVAFPRLDRDLRQEGADTLLSGIRLAQQMALNDFRQNFSNTQWQKSFWQFQVEGCSDDGIFFRVGSDKNYGGDVSQEESAIDPANGLPMFWNNYWKCENGEEGQNGSNRTVSENIFITKKFGIASVTGAGGCAGVQHIGFDHLGRPHVSFSGSDSPDYASYMETPCLFTYKLLNGESFTIQIEPESGFAFIVLQERS